MAAGATIRRKLEKAGVNLDGVEINSTTEVTIAVLDPETDGRCDQDATDAKMEQVRDVLGWGGFSCGSGAWVLRKGYQDKGDWNDKSSAWHY